MKMIYKAPQTTIVLTKLSTHVLVGSNPEANLDPDAEGTAPGNFEARESYDWDIWSDDVEYDDEY